MNLTKCSARDLRGVAQGDITCTGPIIGGTAGSILQASAQVIGRVAILARSNLFGVCSKRVRWGQQSNLGKIAIFKVWQ